MSPTAASSSKTVLLVPRRPTGTMTQPCLISASFRTRIFLHFAEPFEWFCIRSILLAHVLTGGTFSDRLSALTLITQGAPLHNIRALEALKSLAEKRRGGVNVSRDGEKSRDKAVGREERLKAARAVMDGGLDVALRTKNSSASPSFSHYRH